MTAIAAIMPWATMVVSESSSVSTTSSDSSTITGADSFSTISTHIMIPGNNSYPSTHAWH